MDFGWGYVDTTANVSLRIKGFQDFCVEVPTGLTTTTADNTVENSELFLSLFAYPARERASEPLEERLKRFLLGEPHSESLDAANFAHAFKSSRKADYLINDRKFIVELKGVNSDPKSRLERQLKERFAKPDAPRGYGQIRVASMISSLSDKEDQLKFLVDLSSRSTRKQLSICDEQVSATKDRLNLPNAAGLAVLHNDSEAAVEAQVIGYAIRSAFEGSVNGLSALSFVWASVEAHKIMIPKIGPGFAQILAWRNGATEEQISAVRALIMNWSQFNKAPLYQIDHRGEWDAFRPIFFGSPPTLKLH